jgi:hypothetical protein
MPETPSVCARRNGTVTDIFLAEISTPELLWLAAEAQPCVAPSARVRHVLEIS